MYNAQHNFGRYIVIKNINFILHPKEEKAIGKSEVLNDELEISIKKDCNLSKSNTCKLQQSKSMFFSRCNMF